MDSPALLNPLHAMHHQQLVTSSRKQLIMHGGLKPEVANDSGAPLTLEAHPNPQTISIRTITTSGPEV